MCVTVFSYVNVLADAAAIVTAILAVLAWLWLRRQSSSRQQRLEDYLERVRSNAQANPMDNGEGMRSVTHLMAHLYMTESQVYDAAFSSQKIKSWPGKDHNDVEYQVMMQFNPAAREEATESARN